MEMTIIKAIQSISSPIMDFIMYGFTNFGESIFFLMVFFIIYWCYSKEFAMKYTLIYLLSVGVNQIIKNVVKRPRPYLADSTINNLHTQSGYSFPSGHTQAYFVQFGLISTEMKKNNLKRYIFNTATIFLFVMGVMVMVSRQYLGQHYLSDTVVAAILGITVAVIGQMIVSSNSNIMKKLKKIFNMRFFSVLIIFIALILYTLISCFGVLNSASSLGMITMFSGAMLGVSISYLIDYHFIHYNPKDVLCVSVFKAMVGLVMVGLPLIGLDMLFQFNEITQFFLYFIVAIIGALFVPLLFKAMFSERYNKEGKNG